MRGSWVLVAGSRHHRDVLIRRPRLVDAARALIPEMALREGAARTGLQVAFEADSTTLVGEFDDDVHLPWPPRRSVGAAAGIVARESCGYIRRETDVEVWFRLGIREHVNEALGSTHIGGEAIVVPALEPRKTRGLVGWALKHRMFFNRILAWKCENLKAAARVACRAGAHATAFESRERTCRLAACLRGSAASARHPSRVGDVNSLGSPSRSSHTDAGERRMVDQTGIEPVTS
jgi:hypothetical protein